MIDKFSGEYRWLSNFVPCPVILDGVEYPSVEHAYQAAKTVNREEREIILQAKTAGIAKKLSKLVTMRPNWESIKWTVMFNLCMQKFLKEPFRSQLLATEEQELIEGNTWGDVYWGVCKGDGQNNLGKIIMHIRQTIRDGDYS